MTEGLAAPRPIHPLHAVILAGTVPLFLGALLSDLAYGSTYEIQWNNFAAWLLAGAMVLTGLALVWSLVDLFLASPRANRLLLYVLVLLATFVVGLIASFVHARDAWAMVTGGGPILSALSTLLAMAATWIGFSSFRREVVR